MVKKRKRRESLKQRLEAIIIRVPITPTTVTAALLLIQQVIELARVVKVPLQVEKVATLEVVKVAPPAAVMVAPVPEPMKEGET
ncbi:MAG: hypothetical protein ABSE39_04585 [Candidatus Bathyarchaeia archaeon]|jgi:hypothetical protein